MIDVLFFMSVLFLAAVAPKLAPNTIRFCLPTFLKGSLFIFAMTLLGWLIWSYGFRLIFPDFYENAIQTALNSLSSIHPIDLMRVWWEDIVYVWPSLILFEKGYKKLSWAVLLLTLPDFVAGHLYQGPMGLMSVVFVFLARHLGIKYGAITVAGWHIFYDLCVDFRIYLIMLGL